MGTKTKLLPINKTIKIIEDIRYELYFNEKTEENTEKIMALDTVIHHLETFDCLLGRRKLYQSFHKDSKQ